MTAPGSGLVERLRRTFPASSMIFNPTYINPDGPEAAETIELLYASLDRLTGFLGQRRIRLPSKDLVLGDARETLATVRARIGEEANV